MPRHIIVKASLENNIAKGLCLRLQTREHTFFTQTQQTSATTKTNQRK